MQSSALYTTATHTFDLLQQCSGLSKPQPPGSVIVSEFRQQDAKRCCGGLRCWPHHQADEPAIAAREAKSAGTAIHPGRPGCTGHKASAACTAVPLLGGFLINSAILEQSHHAPPSSHRQAELDGCTGSGEGHAGTVLGNATAICPQGAPRHAHQVKSLRGRHFSRHWVLLQQLCVALNAADHHGHGCQLAPAGSGLAWVTERQLGPAGEAAAWLRDRRGACRRRHSQRSNVWPACSQ